MAGRQDDGEEQALREERRRGGVEAEVLVKHVRDVHVTDGWQGWTVDGEGGGRRLSRRRLAGRLAVRSSCPVAGRACEVNIDEGRLAMRTERLAV